MTILLEKYTPFFILTFCIFTFGCQPAEDSQTRKDLPVPVEVQDIEIRTIRSIRVFSGNLEAMASFIVSPKVAGMVEKVALDIGEQVEPRALVAVIEGAESTQELALAEADLLAKEAAVAVYRARVNRAKAQVEAVRIRLSYTSDRAVWPVQEGARVVAERYIDEGQTITANTPNLRIVDLDPLTSVFFVTEKD